MEELQCVLFTPGLEVYHDVPRGWLYTRWLGKHTDSSIKDAIDIVCVYLRGNSYTKILSDHSGLVGNWPEQSPWLMRPYFDALAAQGITYFAWVYNEQESYHNHLAMQRKFRDIARPVVAIFRDIASAYEWLCRCAATPVANLNEQRELKQRNRFS